VAALNESKDHIAETTVYRNIEMLAKEGFIKVISLLEGHNRYELDRGDHHHHLVCTNCDKIVPVEMEEHLTETEHKLEKQHNFKITSHSLEFFGICSQCG
jgi:Fe2+ or Zn2+ uptake regulation protein